MFVIFARPRRGPPHIDLGHCQASLAGSRASSIIWCGCSVVLGVIMVGRLALMAAGAVLLLC